MVVEKPACLSRWRERCGEGPGLAFMNQFSSSTLFQSFAQEGLRLGWGTTAAKLVNAKSTTGTYSSAEVIIRRSPHACSRFSRRPVLAHRVVKVAARAPAGPYKALGTPRTASTLGRSCVIAASPIEFVPLVADAL